MRYFGALAQETLRYLARKPLSRWVSGHRNPQQLSPSMAENKKCEQLLKGNRRNHDRAGAIDGTSSPLL
jgi:hypothetical protein